MKSARVFAVTVLCALMIGTVSGTASAETGSAGILAMFSVGPGDDSGWGLVAG